MRRSLRLASIEATTSRLALAISENFIVPLALVLRATPVQISLLSTLPRLVSAMSQLTAPAIIRRFGSRKLVLQLSAVLSALGFVGMMLVPVMPEQYRVWALLSMAVVVLVFFELPNPAWASWVSDLVPTRKRGKYLALRSLVASASAVAIFLVAGVFLDAIKSKVTLGFVALFAFAAVFRLSAIFLFARMYEPPLHEARIKSPSFIRFVAELPRSNLGHFLLYSFALNFAVNVGGPFFTVYQLRDLQFSYTTYMGLAVTSTLATMVGLRLWGPFSDRHGNLRVIRIAALGVPLLPVLWLVVNDPLDALFMQVIGGLSWAGMTLCSVNFVYEASSDEDRSDNVAYYYALNGVALFLGGLTGGFLVDRLPAIAGSNLLTLFVLSGVLRLAAALFILPWVREVRRQVPRANGVRPSAVGH